MLWAACCKSRTLQIVVTLHGAWDSASMHVMKSMFLGQHSYSPCTMSPAGNTHHPRNIARVKTVVFYIYCISVIRMRQLIQATQRWGYPCHILTPSTSQGFSLSWLFLFMTSLRDSLLAYRWGNHTKCIRLS